MEINKDKIETLLDTKFIKVFDLQYKEGAHYFDATRRPATDILYVKSDKEFQATLPDGVNCFVVLAIKGEEEKLLLQREYRYPIGRFILSPPAGLVDKEDASLESPLKTAAIREIFEETGIEVNENDTVTIENPMVLSSPGMTDESNGLVSVIIKRDTCPKLSNEGAVGGELFDGFRLITKEDAQKLVKDGHDQYGNYYSAYTYMALMWFLNR